MENKWFPERFSEINKDKFILKRAYQVVEEEFPLIQFYYSTPFSNPIYLQIVLCKADARIIKSISREVEGKNQISIQSGNIPSLKLNKLSKLFESLAIKNLGLKEDFPNGRDGYYVELIINKGFHSTTFSWFEIFMPSEWKDLNDLVEVLLKIDKSVTYKNLHNIGSEIFLEANTSSILNQNVKSMILEFKELEKNKI